VRDIKQPRAAATRGKIVQASADLFAIKGFHDTKLDEVRDAAAVTTGAFFHHFAGKDDLGFAVLDRHMEKRRQQLDEIEQGLPAPSAADPLLPVFRRLDAIEELVRRRKGRKGGCIIGNLSTALSDTHEAFRQRLAGCFEEMAREFQPHLDAAAKKSRPRRRPDTGALARYIVSVIEGSIMLARTGRDQQMIRRNFEYLKEHLRQTFGT
jgi:TetR/AcrR family transcriptional repressor of nem operon